MNNFVTLLSLFLSHDREIFLFIVNAVNLKRLVVSQPLYSLLMFILPSLRSSLLLTIHLNFYFRNHDNKRNHNNINRILSFPFQSKKTRSTQDSSVCFRKMEVCHPFPMSKLIGCTDNAKSLWRRIVKKLVNSKIFS